MVVIRVLKGCFSLKRVKKGTERGAKWVKDEIKTLKIREVTSSEIQNSGVRLHYLEE